jgi:hypothetical protein
MEIKLNNTVVEQFGTPKHQFVKSEAEKDSPPLNKVVQKK